MTKSKTDWEQCKANIKQQFRRCWIPAAVACITSAVIAKIGIPIVPFALIGAGGWAWWKGYRVVVVKPEGKTQTKSETGSNAC